MRITLKHTGELPAYRKIFSYVLTRKYEVTNPEALPEFNRLIGEVKQNKFSKFIQKCLEKLFPECDVETKAQFRHIYKGFIDKDILDKYI